MRESFGSEEMDEYDAFCKGYPYLKYKLQGYDV